MNFVVVDVVVGGGGCGCVGGVDDDVADVVAFADVDAGYLCCMEIETWCSMSRWH